MVKKQILFPIFIFLGCISLSCQHHKGQQHQYSSKCCAKHHKAHKGHKCSKCCAKHHKAHKSYKCSKCCAKHHKNKAWLKKEGVAIISPLNNSKITGSVRITKKAEKSILVSAHITGLKPQKKYGFHIHQYGDCREGGKKAGTHLNPYHAEHGSHDSKNRHMGDLGNLESDAKGTATYEQKVDVYMYKLSGRSIIIHAQEDDLKSQPSGNSGPYIGCGVVGWASTKSE